MGDMSELRGLVLIASFIGCLFILISFMPTQLLQGASPNPQSAPYGDSMPNLLAYNNSYIFNFTVDSYTHHFDIDPIHIGITAFNDPLLGQRITMATYGYTWYGSYTEPMFFSWYYPNGTLRDPNLSITFSELADDYENGNLSSLNYRVKNDNNVIDVAFSFNTTLYSTPLGAFLDGNLSLIFNSVVNTEDTNFNGLQFMFTLMSPWSGLTGLPDWINILLKFGLWATIGYILFIAILRVSGAVFGGGGA